MENQGTTPTPSAGAAPEATVARKPCPSCGEMIAATAQKCRFCGQSIGANATQGVGDEEDRLSMLGKLLTWAGVLFTGIIGIVVVSIIYYCLKGKYPNKAAQLNKHSWIAFGVSIVFWIVIMSMK